jgi:hypothetical protein
LESAYINYCEENLFHPYDSWSSFRLQKAG